MVLIYFQARRGTLPGGEQPFSFINLGKASWHAIIPMMMPVIVFGGILAGVATATEVAVLAVVYAAIIGLFVYREFRISDVVRIFADTMLLTGSVMLMVAGALIFAYILVIEQVPHMLGDLILSWTQSPWMFLLIANLVFILVSAVIEAIPCLLIFYPILWPIGEQLGIDPLHFALCAIASSGIGIILPPIGLLLIIVCSIAKVPLSSVFTTMVPYILILFGTFIVIVFNPWLVLVLPRLLLPGF
jgi:C4-dicarboxylate transporter DctM subunit